jgi:hypothetical protein
MVIVTEGTPIAPSHVHKDAISAGQPAAARTFCRQSAAAALAARATAVRVPEKRGSCACLRQVFMMHPRSLRFENALEAASETERTGRCFGPARGFEIVLIVITKS